MDLLRKAEDHVFVLLKDKLSPAYTYHNFAHTARVVAAAKEILEKEKTTKDETTAVLLAAWFHDTGYIKGNDDHELNSAGLLDEFLSENPVEASIHELTRRLILVTEMSKTPSDKLEFIIRDADCAHFSDKNFCEISESLREEWAAFGLYHFTDLEWQEVNLKMLTVKHRYFSNYAKEKWQKKKDRNIFNIQEKIRDVKKEESKKKEKKEKKNKPEKPERGVETMFKVTLNNHTQLSQIADSKANILLSVNAIIISISLSTLIPKLDSAGNTHLIIPTFILMMFSVTCIIFAILSTRPKVTPGSFTRVDIAEKKTNLLFFGNFYKMQLEEYQWAMNEMMKDKDYLYNSMIKDLYFLGLVLHLKYKLLRITYNIFMFGIIVSVIAFVVAFRSR